MKKFLPLVLIGSILILATAIVFYWLDRRLPALPESLTGQVVDSNGPIDGAIVQVQGTPLTTTTDPQGSFTLSGLGGAAPLSITAWAEGYYVGWVTLDPQEPEFDPGQPVTI